MIIILCLLKLDLSTQRQLHPAVVCDQRIYIQTLRRPAQSVGWRRSPVTEMVPDVFERYENVFLVILAVAIGVFVPAFGSVLEPLITPIVIFLVYSSLRGLDPAEIDVSSYAALTGLSLCLSYLVFPIGGIHIAQQFLSGSAVVGFGVALSVPTTTATAIIWTRFARGDVQLATTISLVSLLAAPVVTPIVLTQLVGSQASVPAAAIFFNLLTILVGGALLAVLVPTSTISDRTVERGSTLSILLLIYTSTASVELGAVAGSVLAAIGVVSVLLLGFGLGVSVLCGAVFGLDRARTLPVCFTVALKNPAIALLIGFGYADSLVVVAIIVNYIIQQVVSALVADAVS